MIDPVALAILASIGAVLIPLWRGPSAWDRLLAYNSAANRIIAVLAIVAVTADKNPLLEIAIVYVAISFLGVVVLARFLERGGSFR